jgi:predicted esterase
MGGRTACRVADHDLVRGVVALAPWLPTGEPIEALTGRRLHAAHGTRDRITRPRETRAYVERARSVATAATFTDMPGVGHYLLRGVPAWNAYTLARVRAVLAT